MPDFSYSNFRVPSELSLQQVLPRRLIITGGCVTEHIGGHLAVLGAQADFVHFGKLLGQAEPPRPINEYDALIFIPPMDFLVHPGTGLTINHADIAAAEKIWDLAASRLQHILETSTKWSRNANLTTIVGNFLVPVQSSIGRMQYRYDIRNPIYFTERLNMVIGEYVAKNHQYLLDLDSISAGIGRVHIQDDSFWSFSHGGTVSDADYDVHERPRPLTQQRIESVGPLSLSHPFKREEFLSVAAHEVIAIYKTSVSADQVKLVIIDLDDTLWRGHLAESDLASGRLPPFHFEGVPLGILEALSYLKKRGVLLAICSKNDKRQIERLWQEVLGDVFPLAQFASIKISWDDKATLVAEILKETSLTEKSVVFIDDNPRERAAVHSAFPGMRTLGSDVYSTRRILLWSPELQVATISAEAGRRTEMIKGQIERDVTRQKMDAKEFLSQLNLSVATKQISQSEDDGLARALELINRTNQFNTTGERWTNSAAMAFLKRGGSIYSHSATDRYVDYGTIGVSMVIGNTIEQVVMSCRVIGLGVEEKMIESAIRSIAKQGFATAYAREIKTSSNTQSRELFANNGFSFDGKMWSKNVVNLE